MSINKGIKQPGLKKRTTASTVQEAIKKGKSAGRVRRAIGGAINRATKPFGGSSLGRGIAKSGQKAAGKKATKYLRKQGIKNISVKRIT